MLRHLRYFSSKCSIKEALAGQPAHLKINGWVTNVRKMKNVTFWEVNDGSCIANLQVVVAASEKAAASVNVGSAVSVAGSLGHTPRGQIEIKAESVALVNACHQSDYPFTARQQHPLHYYREFLHLRVRSQQVAAILRLRHAANKGFRDFLDDRGFFNIHTPILSGNDCEGSGEVFTATPDNSQLLKAMKREGVPVEQAYFDKKAFLTVSGQLHLEAMNLGLERVYTFNPAFRAENSKSPCHLAEFHMLEAEVAFMARLEELIEFVDEMVKTVAGRIIEQQGEDLEFVREKPIDDTWLTRKTPTITFKEATEILSKHASSLKTPLREGISKDQELFLVQHFNGPVFVAYWPKELKSFYMRENASKPSLVDCFDLLVPEVGELVGGSVREDSFDRLKQKLPDSSLNWYLDLRKYGSATTSGFGLGLERFLQWQLNVKNIRDVIPFPRWPHNCDT